MVCPHYDDIINFDFNYVDTLSIDLIEWYKDVVFSFNIENDGDCDVMKKIDNSMYIYVNDYRYRKGFKAYFKDRDMSFWDRNEMIRILLDYTDRYEEERVRNIRSSKWI